MVAAYTTLGLIEAEIEGRIVALTPAAFPSNGFKVRPQDARRTPLINSGGPPRIFQLGKPIQAPDTANLYYGGGGGGIRNPSYIIPIEIIYPTNKSAWRHAALDDADKIRSDILNNRATEPAGCEIREIMDTPPEFEEHPEDDWEVMTLQLWTVLTVQ